MEARITELLFALIGAGAGVLFTWLAGRRKADLDGDTSLVKLVDELQKQVALQGRDLLQAYRSINARDVHIEDVHRAADKLPDEAREQFYKMLHTKRPNGVSHE